MLCSLWLAQPLHTPVGALHYSLKKKVSVRLIEPLVVYGEKPALGKDNVNDSDIVHLCFLAQIILPSHLDHEKNRG